MQCVLSDTTVGSLATNTKEAALRLSGWITLRVVVMRKAFYNVHTQDGEHITVITMKTSPYRAVSSI